MTSVQTEKRYTAIPNNLISRASLVRGHLGGAQRTMQEWSQTTFTDGQLLRSSIVWEFRLKFCERSGRAVQDWDEIMNMRLI
jgi:hypothetical protein